MNELSYDAPTTNLDAHLSRLRTLSRREQIMPAPRLKDQPFLYIHETAPKDYDHLGIRGSLRMEYSLRQSYIQDKLKEGQSAHCQVNWIYDDSSALSQGDWDPEDPFYAEILLKIQNQRDWFERAEALTEDLTTRRPPRKGWSEEFNRRAGYGEEQGQRSRRKVPRPTSGRHHPREEKGRKPRYKERRHAYSLPKYSLVGG